MELSYSEKEWNIEKGQNRNYAEEMILLILKEQKVSLAQAEFLFDTILKKIVVENKVNI